MGVAHVPYRPFSVGPLFIQRGIHIPNSYYNELYFCRFKSDKYDTVPCRV